MSAVSEWVAREYFESLGYFVNQPRKYTVPGRQKHPAEEVDIVILNPRVEEQQVPDHLIWTTEDLRGVARAIVAVRGWHTGRFSVATFAQTPDILRFAEAPSVKFAAEMLGQGAPLKILCLPELPASGELRKKTIQLLRDKGIDGIISFRTMLKELLRGADINKNYEKSDLLQVMRVLKNYGFVNSPQLELFDGKRRRPRQRKAVSSLPAEGSGPGGVSPA